MTNILVPTDFTAASLQLAVQAINATDARNANIVLFHAFEMPTSEFELLDPYRQKPYAGLFTESFRQECKQLKDRHPKAIQKIQFKFMEGSTAAMFRNFVDAHEIDLIYCPEHYQFKPVHKKSVDPLPMFLKSGIRVIRATVQTRAAEQKTVSRTAPSFATAE